MIVVNLQGGLGNQMFQYATGLAVAEKLGFNLKFTLDLIGSHRATRSYELQTVFGIDPVIASRDELSSLLSPWRSWRYARKFLSRPSLRILRNKKFICDDNGIFISNITERSFDGAYLQGYWQSEKYFLGYDDKIRSCFTFPDFESGINQSIANEMKNCYSIGVHVRRGDYIASSGAASIHHVLPSGYYRTAINRLISAQPDAKVFAFSDDPVWVRECIKPLCTDTQIIEHNVGPQSYRDMHLLSLCDAIVAANSSFSWWAAWLNEGTRKRVIAPKTWFTHQKMNSEHIVPTTWEVIG